MTFDPEGTFTKDSSIFGMPKDLEAKLSLMPCPWEPTTSFKSGTSKGPKAIFEATKQMDLYHPYFKKAYEYGIKWSDAKETQISKLNAQAKPLAQKIKTALENNQKICQKELESVNQISKNFNDLIYSESTEILSKKQIPALIGGDHSSPFGLIKALTEKSTEPFSIVHIDAHFDLRRAYQGFEDSHASIMYNVLKEISNPPKLFQLGLRDFCESEIKLAKEQTKFILDQEMQKYLLEGLSFKEILDQFFKGLSEKVYISFDIDGLAPEFCPNTGTPVPGGLNFSQAVYLIQYLHKKGHKLIGFDLVEVAPSHDEHGEGIDEIIASRILYELSCFALSC